MTNFLSSLRGRPATLTRSKPHAVKPRRSSFARLEQLLLLSATPVAELDQQTLECDTGTIDFEALLSDEGTNDLLIQEDFSDGIADFFEAQVGSWDVSDGRYHDISGGDAITILNIDGTLPADLEFQATINVDAADGSFYSNGVLIFDYQSPTDFKFAGLWAGADEWVIGHRTTTWTVDASFAEIIDASTDYALQLVIENDSSVSLYLDGMSKVTHTFSDSLTDGQVGLGSWNALAHFDDVLLQQYGAPEPEPEPPLLPPGRLPTDLVLQATSNVPSVARGFFSHALPIFHHQSPTDFKFSDARVRTNNWRIGRR